MVTALIDPQSLPETNARRFVQHVIEPMRPASPDQIKGLYEHDMDRNDRVLLTAAINCCCWSRETWLQFRAACEPLLKCWLEETGSRGYGR